MPDFGPEFTAVVIAIATYVLGLSGFYLCSLVLILIHELGHLAAGLACGLRLNRFRISGLEFERTGFLQSKQVGHWRWYWKWFYLWSGWIAMHAKPVALTRTRLRYCVYLLGGVLANFLSACLAWPIAREDSMAGGIAKFFIVGSVLMVVGNLIPFQKLSLESDGMQLLTLIFHRPEGETRLYWWTFLARFEKIRALSDSGQVLAACDQADELIRMGEGLPPSDEGQTNRQRLARVKEAFAQTRAAQQVGVENAPGQAAQSWG